MRAILINKILVTVIDVTTSPCSRQTRRASLWLRVCAKLARGSQWCVKLFLAPFILNQPSKRAFAKSLASEQSRDITFAALAPWFQVPTLTQTLTNTPNHILTLTWFQNLTQPKKWNHFSCLAENWSRGHIIKISFSSTTLKGRVALLSYVKRDDSESASKFVMRNTTPALQIAAENSPPT